MPGKVDDWIIDQALLAMKDVATDLYLCSEEPDTYTEATSTYAVARKDWGAGNVFATNPEPTVPNGRKLMTAEVEDGIGLQYGLATRWAIVDRIHGVLLLDNDLAVPQEVQSGTIWALPSFEVGLLALTGADAGK